MHGSAAESDVLRQVRQRLANLGVGSIGLIEPVVAVIAVAARADVSREVLLDERGRQLGSEEFAALLGRWRDDGVREARFLIGAADGHGGPARDRADLLIAFGAMTWPHMLARAMLAEQLWRATSIIAGHPYHRSG